MASNPKEPRSTCHAVGLPDLNGDPITLIATPGCPLHRAASPLPAEPPPTKEPLLQRLEEAKREVDAWPSTMRDQEPPPTTGQSGVCDCASGRHFEGNKHSAATPAAAEPQKEE